MNDRTMQPTIARRASRTTRTTRTTRTGLAALASLALLIPLAACDSGGVDLETRTFRLEHLSAHEATNIIEPYVYSDRAENPGTMNGTEEAVTVRETADNLDRIARVLEDFDRPTPELRLRFQVIEADGFTGSDPAIADVEEELRELFRFEGYRLVGEGMLSVVDGTSFQQRLTGSEGGWVVLGNAFRVRGGTVRLSEVELWRGRSILETSVNVRAGQTLVMGSARTPDGEGAVILTVRAEEVR